LRPPRLSSNYAPRCPEVPRAEPLSLRPGLCENAEGGPVSLRERESEKERRRERPMDRRVRGRKSESETLLCRRRKL